jgi:hypothetical protein
LSNLRAWSFSESCWSISFPVTRFQNPFPPLLIEMVFQ